LHSLCIFKSFLTKLKIMLFRTLMVTCVISLFAMSARADVVLNTDDATVDWGNDLLDPGYVKLVGDPRVSISSLEPVPGWTGVKISDLLVAWEITDVAPSQVLYLDVEFGGSASGLVVTDKVLIDWSDLRITGPGFDASNYNYSVLFSARYPESHGGLAEGQGGDANGNPNGSFWLDTSVGSQNQTTIVDWRATIIVNFAEGYVPSAGDHFMLEIGGNSLHGGSDSVLTSVPEPGSCSLALLAIGGLLAHRRNWNVRRLV
jgi:hypothetical protein